MLMGQFEAEFPKAIIKVEQFIDKIGGIGKGADDLLGPGGSITLLVTGIGAAFGGLKGAITANLVKDGMDPFTALVVANIAAQIPASLAAALTSTIVNQAIAAYGAKMAAATVVTNTVPGTTPGVGTPGSLFNFAAIGAAIKSFAGSIGAALPVIGAGAAATGGAGLFSLFDPNVEGSLTGVGGPLAFLNASGNQRSIDLTATIQDALAKGFSQGMANTIAGALSKQAAGVALTPFEQQAVTQYNNIYIGTGKVDTVVSESIARTGTFRRGR